MEKKYFFAFLSKIQNWPIFGQKRPKFCHFWPKNSISFTFWPNIVWKLFYILFLYEICWVDYFNNIWTCKYLTKFCPFQWRSCCVKLAKIHLKSTFLAHFKLSMTENFFLCNFLYVKCLINQLLKLSLCLVCLCDHCSPLSGGHVE